MVTVFFFPRYYVSVEGRGSAAKRQFYKAFGRSLNRARVPYFMEFLVHPKWSQLGYLTDVRNEGKVISAIPPSKERGMYGC